MLGSDKGIKLGSNDGEVLGTILENVVIIILWLDFGTELGSVDASFGCSYDGNLER